MATLCKYYYITGKQGIRMPGVQKCTHHTRVIQETPQEAIPFRNEEVLRGYEGQTLCQARIRALYIIFYILYAIF